MSAKNSKKNKKKLKKKAAKAKMTAKLKKLKKKSRQLKKKLKKATSLLLLGNGKSPVESIELNIEEKQKVNAEMMPPLNASQKLIAAFSVNEKKDYKALDNIEKAVSPKAFFKGEEKMQLLFKY